MTIQLILQLGSMPEEHEYEYDQQVDWVTKSVCVDRHQGALQYRPEDLHGCLCSLLTSQDFKSTTHLVKQI